MAPADWPPTVTRAGSPPNAAMFSWTQRSAMIWSWMAKSQWPGSASPR
jgi:hypothetical protein